MAVGGDRRSGSRGDRETVIKACGLECAHRPNRRPRPRPQRKQEEMPEHTTESPISAFVMPDSAVGVKFTDTLDIDQDAHRLYMGDNWSGGVDIFDISTTEPVLLQTVRMWGSVFGVCVAKDVKKVFAGLSGSMVAVVDIDHASARPNAVIARIDTGGRGSADLLDYDPLHRKVYVANRNDGFLTAIDAVTNEVAKRIDGLGAGLEQPRYNPAD